jgi:hypothetical protein
LRIAEDLHAEEAAIGEKLQKWWNLMRMQKEEKIVVVLLLMALGSLAVGFWTFSLDVGETSASSDSVAQTDSGLSLEGLVLQIEPTKSGGNLLLKLDSTPMTVFIPASAGAIELQKQLHAGDRIRIRGTVSDYQGQEELKISRAADVQRLGT